MATLLVVSQVYVPDPASVGQHMADVAGAMVRRGHRVVVYTADRGYDDPSVRYPRREVIDGVEVRRLPFTSLGKSALVLRALAAVSFMVQAFWHMLTTRGADAILFSTVPPLIGVAAGLAGLLRRIPSAYWVMDLNPDQFVELGGLRADSLRARVLERLNRFALRRAALVVALDRFMAERLARKVPGRPVPDVIAPWPHEDHLEPVAHASNPFRARHGLDGKLVVMYSGNHSPSNPLDTLLEAALRMRDEARVVFAFIGGGTGKAAVERFAKQHRLGNTLLLPYQPLSEVRYSLSAADVHVVSLGERMVGVIHPCKVYGAMAVGRPVLFLGPGPSHVSDLLDERPLGWHVPHGDVDGAVAAIEAAVAAGEAGRGTMGARARAMLQERLAQSLLCERFCDRLEDELGLRSPGDAPRREAATASPALA